MFLSSRVLILISIHLCRLGNAPPKDIIGFLAALNSEWLLSLGNVLVTRFRRERRVCQVSTLRHRFYDALSTCSVVSQDFHSC